MTMQCLVGPAADRISNHALPKLGLFGCLINRPYKFGKRDNL